MISQSICQFIILTSTLISFILAIIWTIHAFRRGGRSLYLELETSDGICSRRIDWELIEDMTIQLLTFTSYIFVITHFIVFIATEEWAFGPNIAKGTLVAIIAFTVIRVLSHFYKSVKDASEKRVKYRKKEPEPKT